MAVDTDIEQALHDGRWAQVRSVRSDDGVRVAAFLQHLDAADRRPLLDLAGTAGDGLAWLASPPARGGGVVAVTGANGDAGVVGVARYQRIAADTARFWVFVDAGWRGVGLGTRMVRRMAAAARDAGVRLLVGDVAADNTRMLGLLTEIGLAYHREPAGSDLRATLELRPTETYLEAILADQAATVRATLAPLFGPRSIAVVGASDDTTSIGGLVWSKLMASGFTGATYPVNLNRRTVQGVAAYPNLSACPTAAELVVVCTPAASVPAIVEQAGDSGTRAVCVVSAGFAEAGGDGREREQQLVDTARRHGMRLVGPNCMGVLGGGPPARFNTTFSPVFPPPGRLSFVSQSGALGLAALALLDAPALGIHDFVSVGNSADVTATDVLLYWGQDPDTDVVVAYLESVPDPRTFARVARHVSRRKPIVAVKAGRSSAGKRAAASHTAALAAGDTAVDALFRQAGMIRADTLEELFDVATVLATQPVPTGRRVAVLTNGGGPGILVADACQHAGLIVPELSPRVQDRLRDMLPAGAAVSNPVDMVATSTADHYAQCLRVLSDAHEVDAVIVIFVPPFLTRAEDVAAQIAKHCAAETRATEATPIVASFMSNDAPPAVLTEAGVPNFPYPERAAQALGRVATWAEWRELPRGQVLRPPGVDRTAARRVLHTARPDGSGWLDAPTAGTLLAAYGIPTVTTRLVTSPEEAAGAARDLGCPVVVKTAAAIHKTDLGAVRTGITDPEQAAAAVRTMRARLTDAGAGRYADAFLVQEQVGAGTEMLVGVTNDPTFGPLVAVGLGGTRVEALGDVSIRMTPLTDVDVDSMVHGLRCYPLLTGYRGSPPADVDALKGVLHRVSAMVEDLPELAELDLNPIFVSEHGAQVADIRIRLLADHPTSTAVPPPDDR